VAKSVISTPVEEEILKRLDSFCSDIHRTRAEVLRGLLYSLLIEEKYFIIEEWRGRVKGYGAGQNLE
jgi:hypothetical protein